MFLRNVTFALTALWLHGARADAAWTTNGIHSGLLSLAAPGPAASLDPTNIPGGRNFMGRCTLAYSLWVLEGEPVHDFVFTWDWRPGDLAIARRGGRSISSTDLARYPELRRTFLGLKPLSVTLDATIEFIGDHGEPLGSGHKRISLGSLEAAGAADMLHLPGSPRWADFFDCRYADHPSRDELDRRNKALFQAAARVRLSRLQLLEVSWPSAILDGLAESFEQRQPIAKPVPPPPAPVQAAAPPNPLELAFRAAYAGHFRGQNLDLLLIPNGGHWTGTVLFQGKRFEILGDAQPTGLAGKFSNASEAWPFTATAEGDRLTFAAGSFSALLQRQHLAATNGRWCSPRVTLTFVPPDYSTTNQALKTAAGRLQLDNADYRFTAEERDGQLLGTARGARNSFTFRLGWTETGLAFHTAEVSQTLEAVPNRSGLRVRSQPAVPFTLFSRSEPVSPRNDRYEFDGDQTLHLEARAEGCYPARTNLWLPGYSELTWDISWQKRSFPALESGRWTNSLGMILVPVPGADVLFCVWDTRVRDYSAYAGAGAGVDNAWRHAEVQDVSVSHEPDEPVTMVGWQDARAFCAWLTRSERAAELLSRGQFYRLPTDAEWSLAAGLRDEKGASPREKDMRIKRLFPWGTQWPPPRGAGNFADRAAAKFKGLPILADYNDGFATTSPVGRFDPTPFGLYDLAGNVWQWCDDWYDTRRDKHVLRGGSWRSCEPLVLCASHRGTAPDVRDPSIGFRCVLVVGAPALTPHAK